MDLWKKALNNMSIAFFPYLPIVHSKNKQAVLIIGQVQSGKTNYMIEKSKEALASFGFDCSIILGGTNNNLLDQSIWRFRNKFDEEKNITVIDSSTTTLTTIPDGKSVVITLKGDKALQKLLGLIKNSDQKKIIIFDDESDFGSINISKEKSKSKIHALIHELYDYIDKCALFSVTATPFADLLSRDGFKFSRIEILPTNSDYNGSVFFLKNNKYHVQTMNGELQDDGELDKTEWFNYLRSHIERVYESKLDKSIFLINKHLANQIHEKIAWALEKILQEISVASMKQIFKWAKNENEWKKLKQITVELHDNIYPLNQKNTWFDKQKHSIVIGGVLVSRGYTFEYLITAIMFNEPRGKISADVLLQRARWFGYRKDIFEYMKIYMSDKTREAYVEANDVINKIESFKTKDTELLKKELKTMKFKYINLTAKAKEN